MKSAKEWFKSVPKGTKDNELSTEYFFRDPNRPAVMDDRYFFAPADGVVIYAEETDSDKLFDIKGKAYNIDEVCHTKFDYAVIVIGIFMTRWDVHINRIPYSGYLCYKELSPLQTKNMPMLAEELDLVHNKVDHKDMGYLFNNARFLNTIYAPRFGLPYHVVQIADYNVNVITPFNVNQNVAVKQNQRFSAIRWGSQVDLIVPVHPEWKYEILVQPKVHVEGAVDKLIRIERSYKRK